MGLGDDLRKMAKDLRGAGTPGNLGSLRKDVASMIQDLHNAYDDDMHGYGDARVNTLAQEIITKVVQRSHGATDDQTQVSTLKRLLQALLDATVNESYTIEWKEAQNYLEQLEPDHDYDDE